MMYGYFKMNVADRTSNPDASATPVRRPGRSAPSDGGFVLMLALMLMLALTAVGLIAIHSTASNMTVTGAQRVTNVAQAVTASGAEATMIMGAMNPGGFVDYVNINGGVVRMADFMNGFFDPAADGTGSFGHEVANVNTATWRSSMVNSQLSTRAPGYQVGEYCFIKYTSITDGSYMNMPNMMDANDIKRNLERNALARDLTTLYVGPVPCP